MDPHNPHQTTNILPLHLRSPHPDYCIAIIKTIPPQITCMAVHNSLLYAASVNEINVIHLSNYTIIDTFTTNDPTSGSIKSIAFTNNKIFTAHQDCKIRVWQITPTNHHHLLSTLPTIKDRFLRFMLPRNYVNIRRHRKQLWIEHCDTVSGLFVHEGLVFSVSWDKSIKIWGVNNHRCLESVMAAHEDAVNTVVVSENGTVYTGSADGFIRVWKRAGDQERKHCLVASLKKHKSTVNAIALNGDGSVLFSGGSDGFIMVWEENGDEHDQIVFVEALCGHRGAVLCLTNVDCFLVSGSSDRTVRLWGCGKKCGYECMVVLEGHERPVKSVVATRRSVSNGFISIFSGSLDGEIKVWEISTDQNMKRKSLS